MIGSSYLAYSQGGPMPPAPIIVCGSFDIESYPCVSDLGECDCDELGKCTGEVRVRELDENAHTFWADDCGWEVVKDTVVCAKEYTCWKPAGGKCTNDSQCVPDMSSWVTIYTGRYSYVEPFPQWCPGCPA